jgi:hypothetical protein
MPRKEPDLVAPSVQATVHFTRPKAKAGYGMGFVVRFSVPPRVGDSLTVDQYSIRKIPQEELHQCYWKVVAVEHDLNLDETLAEGDHPLATLRVVVHPIAAKTR